VPPIRPPLTLRLPVESQFELLMLTTGGLIAPVWAWQAFDEEWARALRARGLSHFHGREVGVDDLDGFVRVAQHLDRLPCALYRLEF
jgi:hypothetical protein